MKALDNYTLKEGIYIPNKEVEFSYSDGDDNENYLLSTVKNAKDLSIGSEELFGAIKDWPSNYHLSPKRADLLRPLAEALRGKKVLEIGCGCGAITRYLGELGCTVVALEGSKRRAQITRERCRDLHNVTIVSDNFNEFLWDEKFDFVTLIGVLEYSNLYIKAANPFLKLLEKTRSFLSTDGSLLIAIENKIGLKYWAGAPEDHIGKPYSGIENKYNHHTAVTFGKQEIKQMLTKSGFADTAFLYPFPDYKLPDVVVTENAFRQKNINISNLLVEKFDYMQSIFYTNRFSTTLAAKSLLDNSLLSDFANSFLVVSHVTRGIQKLEGSSLSYIYSTVRKKKYCKETIIADSTEQGVEVKRSYIYNEKDREDSIVKNIISNERYIGGSLLFKELIPIVSNEGWKVTDLSNWATTYYTVLKHYAFEKENELWLDGKYLDLTPFNILLTEGNNYTVFDQEWVYYEAVPLYYVFFRGLVYSLGRITYCESPDETTAFDIVEIAAALISKFLPFTDSHLADCKQREKKLFLVVALGNTDPFSHTAILTRTNFELKSQSLQNEINSLQYQLAAYKEENEKNQSLAAENHYLNTQLQQSLQSMIQQWNTVNDHISNLLQLNHILQAQLKKKEEDVNSLFNEINKKVDQFAINEKLNADKMKLQQELEWYKRTYEKRSILGVIKEKLMKNR